MGPFAFTWNPEEKMTDVSLATQLLVDAFHDRFDSAIIVSGDGDLAPPISAVREDFPHKPIVVAFPPRRFAFELKQVAATTIDVYANVLDKCQLPESLETSTGKIVTRPDAWN